MRQFLDFEHHSDRVFVFYVIEVIAMIYILVICVLLEVFMVKNCCQGIDVSTIGKVEVIEGDDAVLTCNVTRSDGELVPPCSGDVEIEWIMNNTSIASCSARGLKNDSRELKFDPETGSLTIYNIRVTDAAVFDCGVQARIGGYEYSSTELIVRGYVQVSTMAMLEVVEGEDAVLECHVTGGKGAALSPCSVQLAWLVKDSEMVITCTGIYMRHSHPNSNGEFRFENQTGTLTIPGVRLGHAGQLTCRVNTTRGYIHSVTELKVLPAFHQPANTASTGNVVEHAAPSPKSGVGTNVIFNHILGSSAVSVGLCALVVVGVLMIGVMKRRKDQPPAIVEEFSVRFMRGRKDESASTSSENAVANLLGTSAVYQELNLTPTEGIDEQDASHKQTAVTHSTVIAYADVHRDSVHPAPPSHF